MRRNGQRGRASDHRGIKCQVNYGESVGLPPEFVSEYNRLIEIF